jgi:deazaflavin-dependent oxidoreductase (nitroreductase family)
MGNYFEAFTKIHLFIYRVSNGRLGSQLGKQSMLILYTAGRKTGKKRSTTLAYFRDDDRYLVVGSNWGKENHPAWYYNLLNQSPVAVQVGSKIIQVEAQPAQGEEYQRLWQLVTAHNEQYIRYQKTTRRRIPIVILTPVESG